MICVALSDKNVDNCLSVLDKVEMAEIRLDMTEFEGDAIKKVFAHKTPTIATCRPDRKGEDDQLKRLVLAIESGAKFADIELEALPEQQQKIIAVARKHDCRVIISYHNFIETPGLKDLYRIVDACFEKGADIAKLATMSNSDADNAKLMALYSNVKPVVAIGMGEKGKITRIMAPLLGAAFTFAAMDQGMATAPGQITYTRMKALLRELENEIKTI